MNAWQIDVLYYGKIKIPKSAMTPNLDNDLIIYFPYLGFLLRNNGRNILVDTGMSEKFIVDGKGWGGWPTEGGSAYVEQALAKLGLKPDDIETVIYTHLHNDHAGNCGLFKKSKAIAQRDEWVNLINPLPDQRLRRDYDPGVIGELSKLNLHLVDGDIELMDGIKLYKAPGHTLGTQIVAVTMEKGTVVLTSDIFILYCHAFPYLRELTDIDGNTHLITPPPEVYKMAFPPSIVYDYYAWWDNVNKIKAIASRDEPGFIIPGHDPSLLITGI